MGNELGACGGIKDKPYTRPGFDEHGLPIRPMEDALDRDLARVGDSVSPGGDTRSYGNPMLGDGGLDDALSDDLSRLAQSRTEPEEEE